MSTRLFLFVALGLVSCVSPRRVVIDPSQNQGISPMGQPGQPTVTPMANGGGAPVAAASGAPRQRLETVDAHMRRVGFERVGPAVRNANMQSGGLVAYPVDAQRAGECFVPIALSAVGTTMNLFIIDPMGRTVANSVATPNPWVKVCASQPGRFIARLQMGQGSGEYYYALYRGAPQADPQLAAVLGGVGAAAPSAQIDPDSNQRLLALDAELQPQGYNRVGPPFGVTLGQREDHERPLNLQHGTCYVFASIGGPGSVDTDLSILNAQGETLAQEVSRARDSTLQFCPPATGPYKLRALMYQGEGPLFVAGYVRQAAGVAAVQPTTGPVIGETSGGGGAGGLEQRFALLDGDIRARGYEPLGSRSQVSLGEGETREFDVEVEADKCYAMVAVGDGAVRDLDLFLLDSNGRMLDRDEGDDTRAIVRVCSERAGTYKMRVKMTSGSGAFVYHAYRWPRGTRGPFGLRGLSWVRFAEVTQLLSIDGFEPDPNFEHGEGRLRRQGASANHSIDLPAGACYAVVAVGGDGVIDLGLRLSSGSNVVAADSSRDAMPDVRYCTSSAGSYRVDISAEAGSGTYFYQVFRRTGS
ncbi:MAG: hypothetical protein KF901_04625 [Myxococcales bacterium]|nr:hypothetical protein [Myxococcales bacterium]